VDGKKKYRIVLLLFLLIDIVLIMFFLYMKLEKRIPDKLYMYEEQEEKFEFSLPLEASMKKGTTQVIANQTKQIKQNIIFNFGEPFSLYAKEKGSYHIGLKLFGIFPVHSIALNVIEEQELYPGGQVVGIKIDTNGLLVLGTGTVVSNNGESEEPAKNIVQSGDYIEKINGKKVENKEELVQQLEQLSNEKVILELKRGEEIVKVLINAIETERNHYKLGIWVRDDTQGIGTLTYTTKDGEFGALGHGINDVDTGTLMEIKDGYLCEAGIFKIKKGQKGNPGEITGYLKKGEENRLGKIQSNTAFGIKGKLLPGKNFEKKAYPIALRQQVKTGKAYIRCQLTDKVEEYEIKINKININNKNRDMVLQITDERLLQLTNGIVQGMSGSPIIQKGKIVGAVTHVFVNEPAKGYGVFVENMIGQ